MTSGVIGDTPRLAARWMGIRPQLRQRDLQRRQARVRTPDSLAWNVLPNRSGDIMHRNSCAPDNRHAAQNVGVNDDHVAGIAEQVATFLYFSKDGPEIDCQETLTEDIGA